MRRKDQAIQGEVIFSDELCLPMIKNYTIVIDKRGNTTTHTPELTLMDDGTELLSLDVGCDCTLT